MPRPSRARPESERNIQPCMPPLLPEEKISNGTKYASFSGSSCENIVISHFLYNKINCAVPIVDDGADILIEKTPSVWSRGQVKKVVYKSKLDYDKKKSSGVEIYRDNYEFFFQSNKHGSRSVKDTDYFYHVLLTPLREIIWETPSCIIPTKENSDAFIGNKTAVLDRSGWERTKAEINWREQIISAKYDPKIIQYYPSFFLPNTINNYIK